MSSRPVWLAAILILASCTTDGSTDATSSTDPTEATTQSGETEPSSGEATLTCWAAPISTSPGPIRFEDATEQLGLVEPLVGMYGHVAAFGEVNDDQIADLLVGTFGDRDPEEYQERGADGPSPDRLFLTNPELIPEEGWSTELGRSSGAVFADFDGDGDSDLLMVRHAGRDGDFPVPSRLFENEGGQLSAHSEPLPADFRGRTPAVADYDGDGLLDVYVSEDNSGETGGILLRNEGSLGFSDVTSGSGLEGVFSLGAVAGDLDGDLLPDLATSTTIHRNVGAMQFEDATPEGYLAEPIGEEDDPAGVALGDLNRDGITDIVIGQHYRSAVEFDAEVPVRVFLGRGALEFEDVTETAGLTPLPTLAPHVDLADIDNDGWMDIVTTASADEGTAPAVYRNTGEDPLRFEVSDGLGSDQYWIAGPVADVDLDGRLDLFAVEWEPSLPSLMFLNSGESGHWLEVSLGLPGRGIGSVVEISSPAGMIGRQEIGVGGGYSSGKLPVAHFGLGAETSVDVRITLADGTVHELGGIPADQHLRWPEGC